MEGLILIGIGLLASLTAVYIIGVTLKGDLNV